MTAGLRRYSVGQREQALGLLEAGVSGLEVARQVGVDRFAVARWAKVAGMRMRMGPVGGLVNPTLAAPSVHGDFTDARGRLTEAGRGLIAVRLREGRCPARIAAELGVHRASVTRELRRNRVAGVYSVRVAQARTVTNRARPQPRKLDRPEHAGLRTVVLEGLTSHWSPHQIQGELLARFPHDESMRISHEALYQALYVQGRGSLRAELAREKALRSGRTSRVPASKLAARPRGKSWVGDAAITARPAEATDRAVPGHWEGDLVIGARGSSAVITLVERATRYLMLGALPGGRTSEQVIDVLSGL